MLVSQIDQENIEKSKYYKFKEMTRLQYEASSGNENF